MKRFAVIGLGRFGISVARALYDMGAEVLAIDSDRQLVNEIQDQVTHAVALDATNKSQLENQEVDKLECVVVGIGEDFEANVLVTAILREFGIPHIVTRCYNELQKEILLRVGATQVISPEEDIGRRLAKSLVKEDIVDFLELPEGFAVRMVPAPKSTWGKSLAEAKIRNKYMVDIVAIRRESFDEKSGEKKTEMVVIPDGNEVVREGDVLGVIGREDDIEKLS